jgi:thiamine biosynthesis lipoprotein
MTLGAQIAQAGYDGHWTGETAPLSEALAAAPPRAAATPHPAARWQALGADRRAGTIRRPPGVVLDSGGLGKGLAADLVAADLVGLRFVVDVGGDLALGHGGGGTHEVVVAHPLTGAPAHRFHLDGGGVVTSGIHRRLWRDAAGAPAHHLLDPATGRPAWTGLLAVTAVGRSAVEAEVLAKTALLRGRRGARAVLAARGGVIVGEDGAVEVVPALRAAALRTVRDRDLAATA